jgi:hypothetical protein
MISVEKVGEALKAVLSPKFEDSFDATNFDATRILVLLMAFHHSIENFDSWKPIEDMIENIVGTRPDWIECKKLLRKLQD